MDFQRIAASLLLAACAFLPTAQAQTTSDDAEQLTALVVEALPMGDVLQGFIDRQPLWPLNAKASRVSAADLQCLRARLSAKGYREQRSAEAQAFARRYPDRMEDSLRVLRDGGAALFGASIVAGIDQKRTGQKVDFDAVAARFTPGQLAAFIELTSDEKHKALRELIGVDDAVSVQNSTEQNQSQGRNKGMMMSMKLMLGAMDHCKVPLAAVL